MKSNTKSKTANLQPHPLGSLFPPMNDHDYSVLVKGMKKNGFDESHPIILLDGMILDGNHRYTAAKKTRAKFTTKQFTGEDPFAFVVQENLGRRNLTPSQAATVAAELVEKEKEVEKAEREAAKTAAKTNKPGTKTAKPTPKARAKGSKAGRAAKALNVSERNVAAAGALKKDDPEGFKDVKGGKKTLHKATKDAAAKKSAADLKSEAFGVAQKYIDDVCGEGFALVAAKTLSSKDILKFSGLDEKEMIRIKPFIADGRSLKVALGYQTQSLTYANNIRQLTDRAIAQGGRFTLELDKFTIDVTVKADEKASVPGL